MSTATRLPLLTRLSLLTIIFPLPNRLYLATFRAQNVLSTSRSFSIPDTPPSKTLTILHRPATVDRGRFPCIHPNLWGYHYVGAPCYPCRRLDDHPHGTPIARAYFNTQLPYCQKPASPHPSHPSEHVTKSVKGDMPLVGSSFNDCPSTQKLPPHAKFEPGNATNDPTAKNTPQSLSPDIYHDPRYMSTQIPYTPPNLHQGQ
jgi:hypothetical protein